MLGSVANSGRYVTKKNSHSDLTPDLLFFLAKIPYFNYQINFQSHLTKKETDNASKRLSSYCMGALNCHASLGLALKCYLSEQFNYYLGCMTDLALITLRQVVCLALSATSRDTLGEPTITLP